MPLLFRYTRFAGVDGQGRGNSSVGRGTCLANTGSTANTYTHVDEGELDDAALHARQPEWVNQADSA